MNQMLHTMLRVSDITRSIEFYTKILGMEILNTLDRPDQGFSLYFLGYAKNSETHAIELNYNYSIKKFELSNAYGHITIGVDNCFTVCRQIKILGGNIVSEAGQLPGCDEVSAFVEDPDGYKIELIQKSFTCKASSEKLDQNLID